MEVKAEIGPEYFRRMVAVTIRPMILGLWAAGVLAGCSTGKPSFSSAPVSDLGPRTAAAQLEPGAVAVVCPLKAASFSFQPAQGRVESAGEGAAQAARRVLNTPHLLPAHVEVLQAQVESLAGVVGFVAAPFAAGYGAVRAAHQRIPPDKLAEAQAGLTQAMSAMAGQENLRQAFLQSAGEQTRRRLVPLAPGADASTCGTASAVVEASLEELRLERTGAGDSSYAMRIKARARLVRQSDGVVLSDGPYEYRSGKAMFIDWSRQGGFEGVAQTGFSRLADEMASELCSRISEPPVLSGAGYKNAPGLHDGPRLMLARNGAPANGSGVQWVAYHPATFAPIEIHPAGSAGSLSLQKPLTREEAAAEAQSDLEYQFDGLENDRNSVVQALACLAAVPVGLWEQAAVLVRGVPSGELEAADARLRKAARQAQPEAALAKEMARVLAPETAEPVMLARADALSPSQATPVWVKCAAGGPAGEKANGQSASHLPGSEPPEISLEIRVSQAALSGKPGINPPLALRVQAQATLVRARDGQELYSCPVQYRSTERKFTDWAAHDARLFRQELDQCYRQMAASLAERLVNGGLVPANRIPADVLAEN
jgi:hypothetical protein